MDTQEFKQKLQDEITKTEALIEEYKEATRPVSPDDAIGRISRIDAIQNKAVSEQSLRSAEEKLDKLRYALTKVGEPDFGICIKCKQPIPTGRILLMPQSLYCVTCASR